MISFQRLLGREREFCDLLEASAREACHAVDALKRILIRHEQTVTIHEFADARSKDKKITEEITEKLITTFVTPMEREDIEALAEALYKIPKTVEKFAERYTIVADQVRDIDFSKQVALMEQAVNLVLQMVETLRAGRNLSGIKALQSQLQATESEADDVLLDLEQEFSLGSGRRADAWRSNAFNDASWSSGTAPIGYDTQGTPGTAPIVTLLPDPRTPGNPAWTNAYFRKTFTLPNPGTITELILTIYIDDGAVAWLNGQEVGRINVSGSNFNTNSAADSAGETRTLTTTNIANLLVPGTNIIAIQGFNAATSSSDFVFEAMLTGGRGPNLLDNAGFEQGTNRWTAKGSALLRTNAAHTGGSAILAAQRASAADGISQSLLGKMQPGVKYFCSAWARVNSTNAEPLTLSIEFEDAAGSHSLTLAQRTGSSAAWTYLSGNSTLSPTGPLRAIALSVSGPAGGVDFFADDLVVIPWSGLRSLPAGVWSGGIMGPTTLQNEKTFAAVTGREYDVAGTENALKFADIHPGSNTYSFAGADAVVDAAMVNGQNARGHTLVWHSAVPAWITNGGYTSAQLQDILFTHINTVVGRYKDKLFCWDAVNEALNTDGTMRSTIWYDQPGIGYAGQGTKYIEEVFKRARAARGVQRGRTGGGAGRAHHRQSGYQTSQRIRKRVEEIIGWIKTVGGLRRSRYRGEEPDASVGLLCGGHVQFVAHGATGTGRYELNGPPCAQSLAKGCQQASPPYGNTGGSDANREKSASLRVGVDETKSSKMQRLQTSPVFQQPASVVSQK